MLIAPALFDYFYAIGSLALLTSGILSLLCKELVRAYFAVTGLSVEPSSDVTLFLESPTVVVLLTTVAEAAGPYVFLETGVGSLSLDLVSCFATDTASAG